MISLRTLHCFVHNKRAKTRNHKIKMYLLNKQKNKLKNYHKFVQHVSYTSITTHMFKKINRVSADTYPFFAY